VRVSIQIEGLPAIKPGLGRALSRAALIGFGVAIVSLGVVTLVGAHPDGPGGEVIHACVNNSSGAINIVGADDDCRANESPLDWNSEGPEGPQGPEGPEGPEGPVGPTNIRVYAETDFVLAGVIEAFCSPLDPFAVVIGGFYEVLSGDFEVTEQGHSPNGQGWYVLGTSDTFAEVKVTAVCLELP
jgi:hypothetical protein